MDISTNNSYERIYDRTATRVLNKIYKGNNTHDYFRSYLHFFYTRIKIKKAIKRFPQSDAYIFLTFSFSAVNLTTKPIIQFCDWTYDHYFNYFQNRNPNSFELKCVNRENSQINGSDIVFSLFPSVYEYMKKKYTSKVVYLGNVINSIYKSSETEIIDIKSHSEKILFIGSPKYIEGANALIQSFTSLKVKYPSISLHFIGLDESQFQQVPKDVYCYGYLDKADNKQRELYYQLLKEAKVFVNTTPKWSAFSASIEAMYFYTPVIVAAYEEFIKTFGNPFIGGDFCNDNSFLAKKIESIFEDKSYHRICINANKLVKKFTWESYIDKLLLEIEKL